MTENNQIPTGDLTHKITLVTGGSRGIGRAIALALANEGARVVINYAGNEAAAAETRAQILAAGGIEPVLMPFSVADPTAVEEAFGRIKDELGALHVLVNNAGISRDGLLLRFKDADWQSTLETNLSGAFYCARAAAKMMTRQRWGRIINISSVVGESGNAGQVAYAAAKAGMLGLTKTLAQELASRSITVNAITPGFIETDMTAALPEKAREAMLEHIPLKAVGKPEDVAHAVAFLASEKARYITGHVLSVNGGMYM